MPDLTVYGTTWCPDCRRSKQFLRDQMIPFTWVNIEQDADGLATVERLNAGKHVIPTIVFEDGSILVEPSNAELAKKLGIKQEAKRRSYDVIVVGGGPAGLTAALYAAREGLQTLVIERSNPGGQVALTERLDNFPGFPEGLTGAEFANQLVQQAERFGVEILRATDVTSVQGEPNVSVTTEAGDTYCARAIVLAVGSTYKRLGVPGEDDFIGAGVHFCATCDGPLYRGKELIVVGGGNSAVEEGVFLTEFAPKVTLLVRGQELHASRIISDRALNDPKIAVRFGTSVKEFRGDGHLQTIVVTNADGTEDELPANGVFVFVGLHPNSEFLGDSIKKDPQGFVLTSETLETSLKGVFAAGDVRHGATAQVASAAGEGAAVTIMLRHYLQERGEARESAATTMAD